MNSLIRKLIWLVQRRRKDDELREELEFHLHEETEELSEAGMPQPQARWVAHRELGNVTLLHENMRAAWIWTFWERLLQDVQYGVRLMCKNSAFTLLAALSLALGIGANTAIYSFMDSLLLRALPVSDPPSLVVLKWHSKLVSEPLSDRQPIGHGSPGTTKEPAVIHGAQGSSYEDPALGLVRGIFPYPAFELLQKNSELFSSVFAYYPARRINLVLKGQADAVKGEYVSGDYFSALGISSAAGRLLAPDDDQVQAPAVAVVSAGFSQKHFGTAANTIGQSILLNNVPVTIVGITPFGFFGIDPAASPELYLPLHSNIRIEAGNPFGLRADRYLDQHYYWIEMMARLRPGVSLERAQASLAPMFQQWVQSTTQTAEEQVNLPALVIQEGAGGLDKLRRKYSGPLYFLMVLVGLILAIACANVANLLLARATARRGEMALRLSIGASRLRIIRQLLTESILLASLGGALGILVAVWGIRFLTLLLANGQPDFTLHAELNWHVLGVAAALSVLTGVLFGLAPALQSLKVNVAPALKENRTTDARSRIPVKLKHVLVVSQMALSLLILVAAGLFLRTLSNLQAIELGFNRDNLLLFQLNARQVGHSDGEIVSFYSDLQRQLSAIPGVRSVALSNSPLIGDGTWATYISVNGKPVMQSRFLAVGPSFFTTMEIPILLGREINERDQLGSPAVAMVNERFARAAFGSENPLGRQVTFGLGGPARARDMVIVGVTKNARYGDVTDDIFPVVYVPYAQDPAHVDTVTCALRTAGAPLAYMHAAREIVRQADARVPLTDVDTQAGEIDETMNQEIIFARLCSAFGILALVMASVGLYGTTSYNVARRTSEIGIRMALGAQRRAVVWMILRQVVVLAAVGLAISLPAAFATSRFVGSFLYGVTPNDPVALTAAVLVLFTTAVLAGYLPARKASKIDPMIALRHE